MSISLNSQVQVRFHRTLRIPDDNDSYPLPPSLGEFELHPARRLRGEWRGRDFVLPMHQREAMWLGFSASKPHALKVGIGGVDAISGEPFDPTTLNSDPQDYVVVPGQPWLDGIKAGEGFIRQFVAVRLGEGLTVEAQLTGAEAEGGMELVLFEGDVELPPAPAPMMAAPCCAGAPLGLGAGGRMRQEIYEDRYPAGTWKDAPCAHIRIELVDAVDFAATTGLPVPGTPVDAATYTSHGLPWFDYYDPARRDIAPTATLAGVRSIGELERTAEAGFTVEPGQTVTYVAGAGARA